MAMSIHQPNAKICAQFDRFIFIHSGEILCEGTLSSIEAFLEEQGHACPKSEVLTDHLIELCMTLEDEKIRQWKKHAQENRKSEEEINSGITATNVGAEDTWTSSFWMQYKMLLTR